MKENLTPSPSTSLSEGKPSKADWEALFAAAQARYPKSKLSLQKRGDWGIFHHWRASRNGRRYVTSLGSFEQIQAAAQARPEAQS